MVQNILSKHHLAKQPVPAGSEHDLRACCAFPDIPGYSWMFPYSIITMGLQED